MPLFLIALALSPLPMSAEPVKPREQIAETKDRLTPETMRRLVAIPLDWANSGDLPRAKAAFEADLAKRAPGQDAALLRADMLMAFGVMLYTDALDPDDHARMDAAVDYIRRAVEAYRQARGSNHPDLALALNSYADIMRMASGANPSPTVEPALDEAYRIRVATIGMRNAETAMNLAAIAIVAGLPSRTQGQPERIEAAAARLRDAISLERGAAQRKVGDARWMHGELMMLYLNNGRMPESRLLLDEARNAFSTPSARDPEVCDTLSTYLSAMMNFDEAHDAAAEAEKLSNEFYDVLALCDKLQ